MDWRLIEAVEVLLTGVVGEGGGRALVARQDGDGGGDRFGGVGGTSSCPDTRLGLLDNLQLS